MAENKVILIEDDLDLAEIYHLKMQLDGIKAIIVSSPSKAIEILVKEQPDLVLLDIMMPEINGFDLFAQIKKNETIKDIPIYIWSNLAQEKDKERARNLKVDGYLVKSEYTPADLAKKVKELINKK
jgi:two-component system, OmpR family, response regulator VicR